MSAMERDRYSAANFLNEEYKVERHSFLYESSYDAFTKHSLLSKLYVELGNYLSGKNR